MDERVDLKERIDVLETNLRMLWVMQFVGVVAIPENFANVCAKLFGWW